jgi:serine/threonine protein kinase
MSDGFQTIGSTTSLEPIGIPWKGSPSNWCNIPRDILNTCTIQGNVLDCSGLHLYRLLPIEPLGSGTFGTIDSYKSVHADGSERVVAVKRPKHPEVDLFMEALFQWRVHKCLLDYGLGFSVPEVYNVFRFKQTGDVWFSMKAYPPVLLSAWCLKNIRKEGKTFGYLLLQISLVLEVMERGLMIDHRDLKVNNIIVVDEKSDVTILWKGAIKKISFPFHIVFLDFGYACAGGIIDIKSHDGIPPIDLCPKEGRDMFQILVSLWRIDALREILENQWGAWIRTRIESAEPHSSYMLRLAESAPSLNWMYSVTDNTTFRAPLCAPSLIIQDCMSILEC